MRFSFLFPHWRRRRYLKTNMRQYRLLRMIEMLPGETGALYADLLQKSPRKVYRSTTYLDLAILQRKALVRAEWETPGVGPRTYFPTTPSSSAIYVAELEDDKPETEVGS